MKRSTALRHVQTIVQRLRACNGIVEFPGTSPGAICVRRAWLFGSVAKGSDSPNDVDILLETRRAGNSYRWTKGRRFDKIMYRSTGMRLLPATDREFIIWLRRGMKMVSVHDTERECVEIDVKVLIYPRMELP